MTKGEYRVGITFNPSNDDMVGQIKRQAADLIDLIERAELPDLEEAIGLGHRDAIAHQRGEIMRLRALAQTAIEEGAMWAVKAVTKGPMA